jgi:ATP/maltotriose-dependent transcriptional regulator MalT
MLIDIRDTKSAVQILSDCIEHVAIHASLRQRADALLHDLRRQVPSDVFARLKDGREGTDLSTVANRWHEKLQHLAQVGEPEPLLEPLTRTERKLLMLMDSDLSYPEIAELQHVSINTIKTHRKNIYTKLGVNNRDEAIQRARNLHLI